MTLRRRPAIGNWRGATLIVANRRTDTGPALSAGPVLIELEGLAATDLFGTELKVSGNLSDVCVTNRTSLRDLMGKSNQKIEA